jgi:hypothetical protein
LSSNTKLTSYLELDSELMLLAFTMPVTERQCQKFVRLAKERPQLLLANRQHAADLELDSELMLLAFSEDDQAKIRDFAKEEDLSNNYQRNISRDFKLDLRGSVSGFTQNSWARDACRVVFQQEEHQWHSQKARAETQRADHEARRHWLKAMYLPRY